MEDEKLAAYYDELTRKGGGAARFKQGLGFTSSGNDAVPDRGSGLPTATSFLSSFVRASGTSETPQSEKQAQLQSIQNKLARKPHQKVLNSSRSQSPSRKDSSRSRSRDRYSRRHTSRSRSRSRDRYSRRRMNRSRSRSRSRDRRSRHKYRSRSRSRENNRERKERERSVEERKKLGKERNGGGNDLAKLIEGYDNMTPAERVKAKMKLQLSRTAENDKTIGKGSGWERFDFDKDAPLDDEEVEAVEDDAVLVKHIGQSFRLSAMEARKEEQLKAAHDEAMFGAPSHAPPAGTDDEAETESLGEQKIEDAPSATSLVSDQVLTMQAGSWRDRARKA